MDGRFITFEGGEGAGKSTQVKRLAARLTDAGYAVVTTREPGGTPSAEAIRRLLLSGLAAPLGAEGEAMLFAAARADHVERLIRPALVAGKWVICDRFADSTHVYQGATGGVDRGLLNALDRVAVGDARPDLTIILDIPAEIGLARAAVRGLAEGADPDRFEGEALALHQARRRAYLDIAALEPDRCVVIDATAGETEIAERIWDAVARRLHVQAGVMARAIEIEEIARLDAVEGWPPPEAQAEWFGAPDAERTLLDAYRGGRMHHAWLIGGPRGIGKATLAYRFARFVLAHPDAGTPEVAAAESLAVSEEAPAFRKVAARAHPNLLALERPWDDERKRYRTELTVSEIRRTVAFFGSTAAERGLRIAIVDPADDMNASAANALLKILEEPPARSLFLVVSHAPGRLLPTIRSRCRRLTLGPLPQTDIRRAMQAAESNGEIDLAAALAEGSLRRAILLADGEGIAVYREMASILNGLPAIDIAAVHAFADRVSGRGSDELYEEFQSLMRGWLARRVRGETEPDGTRPGAAASLESWAEVWEKLRESTRTAEDLNLDKKQVVLSLLMSIARQARM